MSDLIEQVKTKRNFYRNVYRGALTLLNGLLILIVLLLLANLYFLFNKEEIKYYATSTDGQIYPLKASEIPPPHADFENIEIY